MPCIGNGKKCNETSWSHAKSTDPSLTFMAVSVDQDALLLLMRGILILSIQLREEALTRYRHCQVLCSDLLWGLPEA